MFKYICLILAVLIYHTGTVCPPSDLLQNCTCINDIINCWQASEFDLLKIFETWDKSLNQKHFKEFWLSNNNIKELKENTFKGIIFDKIFIEFCANLTSIHKNAFNGTDLVTDEISIRFNPKLSSPDNSIFDILSKFKNASYIDLSNNNNIRVIPSNAFKAINGYQKRLKNLFLYGPSFEVLGENAFYNLSSLTILDLKSTNITFVPSNAFSFKEDSDQVLDLYIYRSKFIHSYNISKDAFLSLKRPTNLRIDLFNDYKVQYLEEKVFLPFLLENKLNKLLTRQLLDCDDCRNVWLKSNSMIQNRIVDAKCLNNKTINDLSNFKNCNTNL